MIRLLFALALAAALAAAGAWIVDHPGRVAIEFESHRLDTSVAALAVAVAALMLVSALLMLLWRWITTGLWERQTLSRHRRGYDELGWGLAALMEGDGNRAARHARKFEALIGHTALADVLAGRAALAEGDVATARKRFKALEADHRTAALALHGLFSVDSAQGDKAGMLVTARRAIEQHPRADWAQAGLFDSAVALADWSAADKALSAAFRSGRVTDDEYRHRRAAIRLAEARKAETEGRGEDALRLAREAIKLEPVLVPARLLAVAQYRRKGALRRARALIREGWRHTPHPDLSAAWLELAGDNTPARQYQQLEALVDGRVDVESHLALARQAIAADLPGPARAHLTAALEVAPQRRVYLALESLEQKLGNDTAARFAATKAASAPRGPAWQCGNCGYRQSAWSELCGSCGSFATLEWTAVRKEEPTG
ncbi:MAG: heme biosynthesis HemY N-terminal domain-containing protein [Sphingomonadales bacterium]